jgi:DivIVA domain-containing protein
VARKRKKEKEKATEAGGFDEQTSTPSGERVRLTPVEIQQKVFRLAFRGYNERDVDEFLDHITEDVAALHEENKRLRERVAEGGTGGGAGEADQQAEAIVRQAREHAARLVEDAERRAAITGAAGNAAAGLPTAFLLQERQFLQQMASLIQGHAQRLKDEARRARSEAEEEEPAAGAPAEERPPDAGSDQPGAGPAVSAAGVAGAAGVVGATEAVGEEPGPPAEPPAEPPPSEPSAAPEPGQSAPPPPESAPEEATAPWSPVGDQAPPNEEGSADDPLVSAWESAFSGEAGEAGLPDEGARREEEGEPSLRELFWGEE